MRIVGVILLVLGLGMLAFLAYYVMMMHSPQCGGVYVCGTPTPSRLALAVAAPGLLAIAGVWFIVRGRKRTA